MKRAYAKNISIFTLIFLSLSSFSSVFAASLSAGDRALLLYQGELSLKITELDVLDNRKEAENEVTMFFGDAKAHNQELLNDVFGDGIPLDTLIPVSMGSTSTQLGHLKPSSRPFAQFYDGLGSGTFSSSEEVAAARSQIERFLEGLNEFPEEKTLLFFNSIGYKWAKSESFPYQGTVDPEFFTKAQSEEEKAELAKFFNAVPEKRSIFLAAREGKPAKFSNAWAKSYAVSRYGVEGEGFILDLGGRSGTLYHYDKGEFQEVSENSKFKGSANNLIEKGSHFLPEYLKQVKGFLGGLSSFLDSHEDLIGSKPLIVVQTGLLRSLILPFMTISAPEEE